MFWDKKEEPVKVVETPVMKIEHISVSSPPPDEYLVTVGDIRLGNITNHESKWRFKPYITDRIAFGGVRFQITHIFTESELEMISTKLKELNNEK